MPKYDRQQRRQRFEQFEQRLVMSANPLTNVIPDVQDMALDIQQQVQLSSVLEDIHNQTGVANVHEQYGFDGAGQTVAIIDSGIAWDHYALGGGYGPNARVVGGFDFAENDSNPYDDGPAGFHGTHIAGIVGSSDDTNQGVSTGVDLVALRVFDDAGESSLDWVEQALQWVHEHKDSFANPITTVNLSLGTDWNSTSVPDWANLEDEFAQLELDGLFISVAAGNSFQDYNKTGLSYPAVSPFVVPVASHGESGNLSDFSQRDSRVLVAPGESIRSTVPGHLFGSNESNRFLGSTGTSMAAPYVSGASALLRQANEFVGRQNINQDMLYNQFIEAADRIYDQATGGYYYRLNVSAAIDAVVGDDHSDFFASATNMGPLVDGSEIAGTIGKIGDVDAFAFTAQRSGTVTLIFATTHDLDAFVSVQSQDVVLENNQVTFTVVGGREYKFNVGSESGIGHYNIQVGFSEAPNVDAVDLGTLAFKRFANQHVVGQQWYQMTAANTGIMTLVTNGETRGVNFQVQVFDSQMNELDAGLTSNGTLRLDMLVAQGEDYYVKVVTENANIDFVVTNLVSARRGSIFVHGTHQDDSMSVTQSDVLLIDVNGTSYRFNAANFDSISLAGYGGNDSFSADLGTGDAIASMTPDVTQIRSSGLEMLAIGFENVYVEGGHGQSRVAMFDSAGNDLLQNQGDRVSLSGNGFHNTVKGFTQVNVHSSAGNDRAELNGGAGNDRFVSGNRRDVLRINGIDIVAQNFDHVVANGGGGYDRATFTGSNGLDRYELVQSHVAAHSDHHIVSASAFERVNLRANSSDDTLKMYDSLGDDRFTQRGPDTVMQGANYLSYANGFQHIEVISRGGDDVALLYDSRRNDMLLVDGDTARLSSYQSDVSVTDFDRVNVLATNGGYDQASLYGTNGQDIIFANVDSSTMTDSNGVVFRAVGFESVFIDARGGQDNVFTRGSASAEVLRAGDDYIEFTTVLQELRLRNVEQTRFAGNGGLDEVIFSDFDELDLLTGLGDKAVAYLNNQRIVAEDFSFLDAQTGNGASSFHDLDAIDYLFSLRGEWHEQ